MGTRSQSPGEQVIREVSDLTGTKLLDLPPLYDTVDAELIDAFVGRIDDSKLHFEYVGCRVTVGPDGQVTVTEAAGPESTRVESAADD